jgi:2-amino-4-hydroxy-6-hydroxymethyldihydropteridine diphosphokinase
MHPIIHASPRETVRVGIALGSNLGNRISHLRQAATALQAIHPPGQPFLASRIYHTEPRFCPADSPTFLNAVVEMAWNADAEELHTHTLRMEQALGRHHGGIRNGPREIDIDILYVGKESVRTSTLVVPHPRIHERRFVLHPLADIRPDLILPGETLSIRDILGQLSTKEPIPSVYPETLILP